MGIIIVDSLLVNRDLIRHHLHIEIMTGILMIETGIEITEDHHGTGSPLSLLRLTPQI